MKVLLWDIDGTLIRSGNAGHRAMNAAARAVFGLEDAFAHFDFGGRTDPWVLALLCEQHRLDATPAHVERFYAVYLEALRRELHNPRAHTCAGIREILAGFRTTADLSQGLLTGNIIAGARVKLDHFGLWDFFPFGAFADDSGERNHLGPIALERARRHSGRPELRPDDLIVIGDTPHDIACARFVGAHAVATATGGFTYDELAAHQPDLLVRDFSDPEPLQRFIRDLR
ncbi:MAG TPA: HAD family hydrolase [Opitutaceae bacterium]|nr:HAD family hydrolase [Opitutaceae bacterium]